MSLLSKFKNDPLFTKVMRSSGSLFSNNTIALGLSVVQGIMATRLLGPAGFGLIGVVMAFASTVNSIFSFRMSELVVRLRRGISQQAGKRTSLCLVQSCQHNRSLGFADGVSRRAFHCATC
jgi:hypothetical protein